MELRTLDDERLTHRNRFSDMKMAGDYDQDKYELARAGKKQVLKVQASLCASPAGILFTAW